MANTDGRLAHERERRQQEEERMRELEAETRESREQIRTLQAQTRQQEDMIEDFRTNMDWVAGFDVQILVQRGQGKAMTNSTGKRPGAARPEARSGMHESV